MYVDQIVKMKHVFFCKSRYILSFNHNHGWMNPEQTKVSDIMTSDPVTIHALETLEKAIEIMQIYNVKKLPVTQNDDIIGIITTTDISRARPDLSKRFVDSWIKSTWKD